MKRKPASWSGSTKGSTHLHCSWGMHTYMVSWTGRLCRAGLNRMTVSLFFVEAFSFKSCEHSTAHICSIRVLSQRLHCSNTSSHPGLSRCHTSILPVLSYLFPLHTPVQSQQFLTHTYARTHTYSHDSTPNSKPKLFVLFSLPHLLKQKLVTLQKLLLKLDEGNTKAAKRKQRK